MAPALTVLDNFDRANTGSPLYGLGNNWRGDTTQYQIDTNTARLRNSGLLPTGGMVFWNPTSFGANQAASFKLVVIAWESGDFSDNCPYPKRSFEGRGSSRYWPSA